MVSMRDVRSNSTDGLRLLLVSAALGAAGILLALGAERTADARQDQDDYADPTSHPAYYQAGPHLEGYEFVELPLDPDSPFYPSSATTRSGGITPIKKAAMGSWHCQTRQTITLTNATRR